MVRIQKCLCKLNSIFVIYFLIILMASTIFIFKNDKKICCFPNIWSTSGTVDFVTARSNRKSIKHVTKSLSALGQMNELNPYILFLNSVPNCGSEIIILLLQHLQGWNNFKHVRLKYPKNFKSVQQEEMVHEVDNLMRNFAVPLTIDGQMRFINFTVFDRQSPTFINLIRDPAEQLTSRILAHSNESLESLTKCVIQKGTNCMNNNYTSTISYFCGQDEKCGLPNSQWALQQAQANVNKYYSVVGVLEELNTTLLVLEVQLPYFFKKSSQLYFNHLLKKHKKKKQRIIHQALRDYLRKKLDKEYEFYNWIKDRLSIQISKNINSF